MAIGSTGNKSRVRHRRSTRPITRSFPIGQQHHRQSPKHISRFAHSTISECILNGQSQLLCVQRQMDVWGMMHCLAFLLLLIQNEFKNPFNRNDRFNCGRKVWCKLAGAHRSASSPRIREWATRRTATASMAASSDYGTSAPESMVRTGAVVTYLAYVSTWMPVELHIIAMALGWAMRLRVWNAVRALPSFQPYRWPSTTV